MSCFEQVKFHFWAALPFNHGKGWSKTPPFLGQAWPEKGPKRVIFPTISSTRARDSIYREDHFRRGGSKIDPSTPRKRPPPDHGFWGVWPRPTTMSEGLTDQASIAMDSCHVLMGVEDTCLGPLKKGPKRVPKWSFLRSQPSK